MTTPAPAAPPDVAALLALLVRDPGRPRVTWYGDGGERVELSAAVLDNWVSKITNLLIEEHDAGPGTVVVLDLPPHWRTLTWALAAWRAGACVALPGAGSADVVVTATPDAAERADVVAVALGALERRFAGPLPPGAVDAAAAVMTYGDVVGLPPRLDPDAPALVAPGAPGVPHRALLADLAGDTPRARVLAGPDDDLGTWLRAALGVLVADGSLVLVDDATRDRLLADAGARARVVGPERVTDDRLAGSGGRRAPDPAH